MYLKRYNTKQKQIYFKAYSNVYQLETALNRIKVEDISDFQISILGKVSQYYMDTVNCFSENIGPVKAYWKSIYGKGLKFGSFFNPELGNIFIVASLVSTFLHKVDGKSLATLSSGSYGIFRGMGVDEYETTECLKTLRNGKYLLIIRGFEENLWQIEHVLENQKTKS